VSLDTAPTAPADGSVYKRLPTPLEQSRNIYDWRPPPAGVVIKALVTGWNGRHDSVQNVQHLGNV